MFWLSTHYLIINIINFFLTENKGFQPLNKKIDNNKKPILVVNIGNFRLIFLKQIIIRV